MVAAAAIAANKKRQAKAKAKRDALRKQLENDKKRRELAKEPKDSMPFSGSWVEGLFELKYVAQKAGTFALHVWCVPSKGERERLPGSPFTLSVSEGQPASHMSFLRFGEALREEVVEHWPPFLLGDVIDDDLDARPSHGRVEHLELLVEQRVLLLVKRLRPRWFDGQLLVVLR